MSEMHSVLDHGYIKIIESWGSDERIIETARMSTGKGFLGWGPRCHCGQTPEDKQLVCHNGEPHDYATPGDEKLLRFLWENKHATPFEMAGAVVEVKAPIMVFREWHRHRTQCAHPDTLVHFDAPKSRENRRFVYKMRIEHIWRKWQPTTRANRPERQTNALFQRSRIQAMQLRCLDEEAKEFGHTSIVDIVRGEPKEMVRISTTSGRSVALSFNHRVLTSAGWMHLADALKQGALLTLEGTTRGKAQRLVPVLEEIAEVTKLGMIPTYDLAVDGPWHNFVADGFVVHNSYNEMSARYTPLPNENYIPTVNRLLMNNRTNKQAGTVPGACELTQRDAEYYRSALGALYDVYEKFYQSSLTRGVPKELARLHIPVGRYSKMRASANLRNWLAFLDLRMAPNAQWEICQYANALAKSLRELFPRTMKLFDEQELE